MRRFGESNAPRPNARQRERHTQGMTKTNLQRQAPLRIEVQLRIVGGDVALPRLQSCRAGQGKRPGRLNSNRATSTESPSLVQFRRNSGAIPAKFWLKSGATRPILEVACICQLSARCSRH